MPKRRGIVFREKDVSKAVLGRKLDLTSGRKPVYSGKIYLKPGNFPRGKAGAQRVFLKAMIGANIKEERKRGRAELAIRQKLKAAGLPVLKSGLVEIKGKIYLAIESFLVKGGAESRLVPINTRKGVGNPYFLRQLTVEKNAALIRQLGKDTATIFNQGITPKFFDFFGFYRRKDGSWARVIMDTEYLSNNRPRDHNWINLVQMIETVWKAQSKELGLFRRTFEENLSHSLPKKWLQKKKRDSMI